VPNLRRIRARGLPVVVISHNMPHVVEIADRVQVPRLGRRLAVVRPEEYSMAQVVAGMTGAMTIGDDAGHTATVVHQPAAGAAGSGR